MKVHTRESTCIESRRRFANSDTLLGEQMASRKTSFRDKSDRFSCSFSSHSSNRVSTISGSHVAVYFAFGGRSRNRPFMKRATNGELPTAGISELSKYASIAALWVVIEENPRPSFFNFAKKFSNDASVGILSILTCLQYSDHLLRQLLYCF